MRVVKRLACRKRSKMLGRNSGAMPTPVGSRTRWEKSHKVCVPDTRVGQLLLRILSHEMHVVNPSAGTTNEGGEFR